MDTPHKKVKLNEDSTLEPCESKPSKTSVLNKLKSGALKPRDESTVQLAEVSPFELPLEFRKMDSLVEKMEEEPEESDISVKLQLNRKFTCGFWQDL